MEPQIMEYFFKQQKKDKFFSISGKKAISFWVRQQCLMSVLELNSTLRHSVTLLGQIAKRQGRALAVDVSS